MSKVIQESKTGQTTERIAQEVVDGSSGGAGPQGPQGDIGPQGDDGSQGPQGPAGGGGGGGGFSLLVVAEDSGSPDPIGPFPSAPIVIGGTPMTLPVNPAEAAIVKFRLPVNVSVGPPTTFIVELNYTGGGPTITYSKTFSIPAVLSEEYVTEFSFTDATSLSSAPHGYGLVEADVYEPTSNGNLEINTGSASLEVYQTT